MNTHLTKVITKTWLEEGARGCIEWASGGTEDLMHDWRNFRILSTSGGFSLEKSSPAFARIASIAKRVRTTSTLALHCAARSSKSRHHGGFDLCLCSFSH